jgi:hypothetical protein
VYHNIKETAAIFPNNRRLETLGIWIQYKSQEVWRFFRIVGRENGFCRIMLVTMSGLGDNRDS